MELLGIGLICYLLIINMVGFSMMGIDKNRARRGAWRISEAALFGIAAMGGSIGCIAGMEVFRHKTRHWYFKLGMPAILVVQVVILILLLRVFYCKTDI